MRIHVVHMAYVHAQLHIRQIPIMPQVMLILLTAYYAWSYASILCVSLHVSSHWPAHLRLRVEVYHGIGEEVGIGMEIGNKTQHC